MNQKPHRLASVNMRAVEPRTDINEGIMKLIGGGWNLILKKIRKTKLHINLKRGRDGDCL